MEKIRLCSWNPQFDSVPFEWVRDGVYPNLTLEGIIKSDQKNRFSRILKLQECSIRWEPGIPKFYTEHCRTFIFLSQLFRHMYLEFSLTLWAQLHMGDSVRVGKGGNSNRALYLWGRAIRVDCGNGDFSLSNYLCDRTRSWVWPSDQQGWYKMLTHSRPQSFFAIFLLFIHHLILAAYLSSIPILSFSWFLFFFFLLHCSTMTF